MCLLVLQAEDKLYCVQVQQSHQANVPTDTTG